MTGRCNLCNKTKELQRICHVIPDFFYRESELFHKYHNLVYIDLKTFLKTGEKKVLSNKQKTGEFDLFKLCKDCDGKVIGAYESYGREFFYSQNLPKGKELILADKDGSIECSNADYKKLKLLFLSILWRASFSDRPLFSEIGLDENISEEIRKMLLNGVPKSDIEFPVFFMNTMFDKKISNDYLFQPIKMRVANENGFMFAFGGMIVTFTQGIDGLKDSTLKYRIQENGIFRALKVPPGKTWKLITKWYKK